MTEQDTAEIRELVALVNEHWRAREYDAIGALLEDEVVIATPEGAVRGREAYVQSYRSYDEAATTHEFEPGEPTVDVVGAVAVAVCPYRVVYELQGRTYRERGRDMLVLSRTDRWRIAWRTMVSEPDESQPDDS